MAVRIRIIDFIKDNLFWFILLFLEIIGIFAMILYFLKKSWSATPRGSRAGSGYWSHFPE